MAKIENITGIPQAHSESFQVLKYEVGQRYTPHHDYGGGAQANLGRYDAILI